MKKMGTAICLSSALLMSTAVQAGWQGNWLVGISGGYAEREGRDYITSIDGGTAVPAIGGVVLFAGNQTVFNQRFEDTGWIGSLFAGYQWKCNRWLVGAEVNIDWRDYDETHDFVYADATAPAPNPNPTGITPRPWIASMTYERDWVLGLTGRMGYELAPYLMPYIRLGAEWSRDKLQYDAARQPGRVGIPNVGIVALPGTIAVSANGRENSYRLVGGMGLEVPVPTVAGINGLAVRAEYDYHSKGRTIGATAAASDNITLVNTSMNPSEQSMIVSLVWNI